MAIFVNTNVSSLHGQRYLNNVNNSLNTTYQRLSSGLRINSAKDDAAGLQIADRLTTQINGLNQGNRNASDGIALMQTMEGGMDEISNMLQRMRTLAVQAANGTITSDDRAALQKEADALSSEIYRIAEQTTFGGKKILAGADADGGGDGVRATEDSIFSNTWDVGNAGDGTAATARGKSGQFTLQVGANSGDTIGMKVDSFMLSDMAAIALNAAGGSAFTDNVASAAQWVAGAEGADADLAAGNTALHAIGLKLNVLDGPDDDDNIYKGISIAVEAQSAASAAISTLDKLIAQVDSQRADLGAAQNRLESSIRNQSNVSTNSADARSRIRDTDFAEESAALSQQNIIQQAATSMLMQANMRPQLGLSLLG